MPLITEDEVRRVVNNRAEGKAKGVDGWSPAELRALSRTHIKGPTYMLNKLEKNEKWPKGLNPIIALIPKDGAENEGQLRPIAILPYIYRVWMAIQLAGNTSVGNCSKSKCYERVNHKVAATAAVKTGCHSTI
eukprot:11801132-Heterocapsa_arctica.AAC.1